MNKLLIALFAGLLSTQAIGAVSDVDRALVEKGFNVFRNGGAENGKADWSASGGTLTAVSGSKASGQLGISWDSSAAAQTLILTSSVNIPDGLKGRNGAALCKVRVPSGTATHTFTVDDGTNNLATAQTIPSQTTFQLAIVNFVYPNSSVPLRFKFTSVASNEPAIDVDECVGTDAFNILQVSQAVSFGSAKWPATVNCEWSQSGAGPFAADADCTNPSGSNLSGNASAPATKVPGIRFANGLPPGEYLVMAIGEFYCNNASNNCVAAISLSDGTNRTSTQKILGASTGTTTYAESISVVAGRFNYTTAQGDTTIQLYSEAVAAGNLFVNANTSSTSSDLQFIVYRFPSSSEIAYRPEIQNSWASTYWPDGTASFSTTSASYVSVTAASMLGTAVRTGQATACSDTNAICLKVQSLPPGNYKIEYSGGIIGDSGTSCSISAYDGSTDYEMSGTNGGGTIIGHTTITYSSQQTGKEFTIRIKRTSGVNSCQVATSINLGHNITITPLDVKLPVPVLVGSVTSGATGAMRVEAAFVAAPSGGACAVTESGSSDWINGSATSAGAGRCAYTFNSNIFSAAPVCTCVASSAAARMCSLNTDATTSGVETVVSTIAGAGDNQKVTLICVGPR